MQQKAVVKISGGVQGVGFRFTARSLAKRFAVSGRICGIRSWQSGTGEVKAGDEPNLV